MQATVDRRTILKRTIAILEERGWWQNPESYEEQTKSGKPGKVSVSRAIRIAVAELGATEYDMWEARYALLSFVGGRGIESWNDSPKTNKQTVFETLTSAIAREKDWDNHMAWAWRSRRYPKHKNGGPVLSEAFVKPPLFVENSVERARLEGEIDALETLLGTAKRDMSHLSVPCPLSMWDWFTLNEFATNVSQRNEWHAAAQHIEELEGKIDRLRAKIDGTYFLAMMK